jgi:WD40 repeat protein
MALTADGRLLAPVTFQDLAEPGTPVSVIIAIWDVLMCKELLRIDTQHNDARPMLAPNGMTLVYIGGYGDATLHLCEVATGKELHRVGRNVVTATFARDSTRLASADENGSICIWEIATGKRIRSFDGHPDISALAFSSDGQALAVAGKDGTIRFLDV